MKRMFYVLALLFLVAACGNKEKGFVPEHLLSEQEMINVMTDVQIIEADVNYRKMQEKTSENVPMDYKNLTRSYYDQLFSHYGITDSIFMQNMRYYTEHSIQLEKIMDSVSQRIVKAQAAME